MNTINSNNVLDLVNKQEYIDRLRLENDRSTRRIVARTRSMELSRLDLDQLPLLSPGLTGLELALRKHWEVSKTRSPQEVGICYQRDHTKHVLLKTAADRSQP